MKKPITLLIALSLVGVSGCSSAKPLYRPKGIKLENAVFANELLGKIDSFINAYPVIKTRDAEDVKSCFAYKEVSYEKENMTGTLRSGKQIKMNGTSVGTTVVKLDYHANTYSYVYNEEGKYKTNGSVETNADKEDYYINEEFVYDNVFKYKRASSAAMPITEFLSDAEDFFDEIIDMQSDLASQGVDSHFSTYKLGNTYTVVREMNISEMGTEGTGIFRSGTQVTITKDKFCLLGFAEAKNVVGTNPELGLKERGTMLDRHYYEIQAKDLKLKAPSGLDKYSETMPM